MTRDEARRIIGQSRNPERAAAMLRSRVRREQRQAARASRMSVETYRVEQFKAAVEKSFAGMQERIVPRVLRARE